MSLGDGLAVADAEAAAVAEAVAGLFAGAAALAWPCVAGEPGEPVGWAARAAWEPAKVSSRTPTAATTHAATAVVAIAAPGLARTLFQLTCLTACASLAAHVDSARRTTRRR